MTITLPDEMRTELEREAKAAGLANVDEYVLMMYLRAKHMHGPRGEELMGDFDLSLADGTDTPERIAKRRERLNQLIQEGLDSGPSIPVTPEFWAEMRRRLEERMAAKGARP
jgi:hypothetical protein